MIVLINIRNFFAESPTSNLGVFALPECVPYTNN